jgi:hypothetical protein
MFAEKKKIGRRGVRWDPKSAIEADAHPAPGLRRKPYEYVREVH